MASHVELRLPEHALKEGELCNNVLRSEPHHAMLRFVSSAAAPGVHTHAHTLIPYFTALQYALPCMRAALAKEYELAAKAEADENQRGPLCVALSHVAIDAARAGYIKVCTSAWTDIFVSPNYIAPTSTLFCDC